MYLVGARFDDLGAAQATLIELRERIGVDEADVELRPLGSLRYEQPASGLVVAGRFAPDDVDVVAEIMQRNGGEIVFRRAEWRFPRPRSRSSDRGSGRATWLSRLGR